LSNQASDNSPELTKKDGGPFGTAAILKLLFTSFVFQRSLLFVQYLHLQPENRRKISSKEQGIMNIKYAS